MAVTTSTLSIPLLGSSLILKHPKSSIRAIQKKKNAIIPSFKIQAAASKLPPGVELPKVEPKFEAPFFGFTTTAEVWNSRVCMVGLVGIFIIELIINKGILQWLGVEVGKGLNLPL